MAFHKGIKGKGKDASFGEVYRQSFHHSLIPDPYWLHNHYPTHFQFSFTRAEPGCQNLIDRSWF
jgi:hypothetical protein